MHSNKNVEILKPKQTISKIKKSINEIKSRLGRPVLPPVKN